MIKKEILITLFLVFPLFHAYGNNVIISYEKDEQEQIAREIGNDLYLISAIKPEIFLLKENEKIEKLSDASYFQIKDINGQLLIRYQNKSNSIFEEFKQANSQPPRKFVYETIEKIFHQNIPKEKTKIKLIYSLVNSEELLTIKKTILKNGKDFLKDQLKNLNEVSQQDLFIMKLSGDTLNQLINKNENLFIQRRNKEISSHLKFLELVVLNQVNKNLKSLEYYDVSEIFGVYNSENHDQDFSSTVTLTIKPNKNSILIKASATIPNKKVSGLLETKIGFSEIENQNLTRVADKISLEIQKLYPVKPISAGIVFNDWKSFNEKNKNFKTKKDLSPQDDSIFSLFAGIVWNSPKKYNLGASTLEQKTNPFYGISAMGMATFFENISFLAKFNFMPSKKKIPIIDSYAIHYGNSEISYLMDFLIGVNTFVTFKITNFGFTVQSGLSLSKIGISPEDPAAWVGKDTNNYFFSGLKLQAGAFIQIKVFIPFYLEFLYQTGKTEGLNHKGFAANFLINVISF